MNDIDLQIDNLPNRLTIMRILLIPVVIGLLLASGPDYHWVSESSKSTFGWAAAWIFGLAAITDYFDGYIARKRNIVTVFGSFLDPIADKFLVVSSLLALLALDRVHVVVVIVLVLREMYMTSLRLLALGEEVQVPVNQWGKWKTAAQMAGTPFLMAYESWMGIPMAQIGTWLLYLATFLSLLSSAIYSLGMINSLKERRKLKKEKNNG